MSDQPGEITRLLLRVKDGDPEAESALFDFLYRDLKRIAAAQMRGANDRNRGLSPSDLVHDVYVSVRVNGALAYDWRNRRQFIAVMAKAIRLLLIDLARRDSAQKRQHAEQPLGGLQVQVYAPLSVEDRLILEEAITELRHKKPRYGEIIDAHFFCGESQEQTAESIGVSRETVVRDIKFIKAWLGARLAAGRSSPDSKKHQNS